MTLLKVFQKKFKNLTRKMKALLSNLCTRGFTRRMHQGLLHKAEGVTVKNPQ